MTRSLNRLLTHHSTGLVYVTLAAVVIQFLLIISLSGEGNAPGAMLWLVACLGSVVRIDNWLVYDKPKEEAHPLTLWVDLIGSLAVFGAMYCTFTL
jgi:hypothetical protein